MAYIYIYIHTHTCVYICVCDIDLSKCKKINQKKELKGFCCDKKE